ncbi:MAG: 3-dehydroquinate synthase, partial [Dyadobacter sp.]
SENERLYHGEAIAVGMVMESYLSYKRGLIDQKTLIDIEEFIFATYGRVMIKESDVEAVIALTRQDKKNRGSEIRFSLLEGAGKCAYDIVVSVPEMRKAVAYYMG